GKNEQSHQDPAMAEALINEMSDTMRVLFPVDWNSAVATLEAVYGSRGCLFNLVIPKRPQPALLSPEQARQLVRDGIIDVRRHGDGDSRVQLLACGAYQLTEALAASARLEKAGVAHVVYCLLEPARLRTPRDADEAAF